jgi:hypothetical protein
VFTSRGRAILEILEPLFFHLKDLERRREERRRRRRRWWGGGCSPKEVQVFQGWPYHGK